VVDLKRLSACSAWCKVREERTDGVVVKAVTKGKMYLKPSEDYLVAKGVDYVDQHDARKRSYEAYERYSFECIQCLAYIDKKADNNVY
jgi:hypothetical protein